MYFYLERSHSECGHQPDGSQSLTVEVDDEVSEVASQQTVDSTTGTHQADLRVQDTGGQRAGQDARGVDEADPGTAVNHLQRDSEQELDGDIEGEMPPGGVDETVAEEPPELSLPAGRINQERVQRDVGPAPVP